ncbi:barstar family protein [Micromonospora sp. 15K316]|uniref:barstar family protein n=1 Tax=Micromonospora sp. 15K316 TaxID=2530376 RepID=UPI001404D668|nr:barstar family protein [Micromonospora sp. 15K316]
MADHAGERPSEWLTVVPATASDEPAVAGTGGDSAAATHAGPGELGASGVEARAPVVRLAGAVARTRDGLFAALTDALTLPAHFGRNWDALADVLRDRLTATPLTLHVEDAGQLLADEPAGQHARFLAVLGDVAAEAPHPLRVVLRERPPR